MELGRHEDRRYTAAVEAGQRLVEERRRSRLAGWLSKKPSITLCVDLQDDDAFAIAGALAPFTVGGTGLDDGGRIIWDGNDTGTSAAFRLPETDLVELRAAIEAAGGDLRVLVTLK